MIITILDKIINLINRIIDFIVKKICNLLVRSTPNKIKNKWTEFKKKRNEAKLKDKESLTEIIEKLKAPVMAFIAKVQSIATAVIAFATHIKLSDFSPTAFKNLFVKYVGIHIRKAYLWYKSLSGLTMFAFFSSLVILVIASVLILDATKGFRKKSRHRRYDREIVKRTRPEYYKIERRQILVRNITLPVYIETRTSIRSLTVDFILESSNRYIKSYLYDNEFRLKNKLNNSIETIIPEFPLTIEGKGILKYKIKEETNNLLKSLNIKGEITKVYFQSILAG